MTTKKDGGSTVLFYSIYLFDSDLRQYLKKGTFEQCNNIKLNI